MNNNIDLWEKVSVTNPKNTKEVQIGARKYTTIDAYSRLKRATELWGPYGSKWGIRDEHYNIIYDEKHKFCSYTASLFYPDGALPIMSDIEIIISGGKAQGKYNEDWSKKVSTDALTKGLSKLGFNADVFMGKFEDSKYVSLADAYENNPIPFLTKQIEDLLYHKANPGFNDLVKADIKDIVDKDVLSSLYRALRDGFKANKPEEFWRDAIGKVK